MTHKIALSCFVLLVISWQVSAQTPEKPVWPNQFDCPFGLNCNSTVSCNPTIHNATSHFYYDWDLVAQVIDYPQVCIPALVGNSEAYPCTLYFNQDGTYLQQLGQNIECCSLFPGVGPVPPQFLAGFHYSNVQKANDMYGNVHICNHWTSGITQFGYWTDQTTGHDVQFKDGPTGIYWNFGNFNVAPQNPKVFQLPSSDCSTACSADVVASFVPELCPFLSLALAHHKNKV